MPPNTHPHGAAAPRHERAGIPITVFPEPGRAFLLWASGRQAAIRRARRPPLHTRSCTRCTRTRSRAPGRPAQGPRRPLTARRGLRRSAEPCPVTPGAPKGWARAEGPGVDGGGLGPPRARGGPAGGRPRSGGRARRAGFARGRQGEAGAARTPQGPRSVGGRALRRSPSKRKMEVGFCEPGQTAVLWDKGLTLGEHAEKAQRWPSDNPIVWGPSRRFGVKAPSS